MAKSQFVEGLDRVQTQADLVLRALGFLKKGRTHNRLTKGGLTHVINFQKEKYAGQPVIRLFRKTSYGEFAVNLGVFLPCVCQIENQSLPSGFIEDFNCSLRQRLGALAFWPDRWFQITDDTSNLSKTVVDLLQRFGLDFLNSFQTYDDVLLYYRKHNNLPGTNSGRACLEAALISHHVGDAVSAQALFEKAFKTRHEGFKKHVAELAKRAGFTLG